VRRRSTPPASLPTHAGPDGCAAPGATNRDASAPSGHEPSTRTSHPTTATCTCAAPAGRSCRPYGFQRRTRELVLVEGFLDYHQLAAHGIDNAAALGSTRTTVQLFEQLSRLGVATVTLCLDNDAGGRDGTVRGVENAVRAKTRPTIYVANTNDISAKDPDALVREHGIDAWRKLIDERECGIVWRVEAMLEAVSPDTPKTPRRDALHQAGRWLGTLPPRLALEVEDAIQAASQRTGYDPIAVERAFHAKFWRAEPERGDREPALHPTRELDHSIDL
jgi:hypothetical protein